VFWRLDTLRRFLLESVNDPDVVAELHRVDRAERIALERQGNLEHSEPIGFAMSALPPSAAIVSAVRQIDLAPSGKVSNSFCAALSQETGLVRGVIVWRRLGLMLSYLTTVCKERLIFQGAAASARS
jgi:hypothetical protein